METNEYLKQYYELGKEDGRLRTRHGSVEFLTTVRYVEKYLKENDRILEIGAGTGRYSHYFAQKGYKVDSVELVEYNIEVFRKNTQPGEDITVSQGNALDLSRYEDGTFDIVLLLGPMYHLYTDKDRKKALSEAIRVAKKNGIIFAAYCNSDSTMLQYCFVGGNILSCMERGMIDIDTFKCKSTPADVFALYIKSEIDALMADFSVTRLHYVATDMASRLIKDTVDAMTDEVFDIYMRYHFSVCERPDLVGATDHMLDIFRKD